MKNLRYFIIILAITLLIYPLSSALAIALEINYPSLGPGTPLITNQTVTLSLYLQYVFIFAYTTAGIIGVMIIIISGFQILVYAGSPTKINEARERIFNAILGIVLLFSSYILLKTINPNFLNPSTAQLGIMPGVYLVWPNRVAGCTALNVDRGCITQSYLDGYVYSQAPNSVRDTLVLNLPILKFFYYCPPGTGGQTILLWKYNDFNYKINNGTNGSNTTTVEVPCGSTDVRNAILVSNPTLSFFWGYQNAGVYYYMTPDCSGISSYFGDETAYSAAQTTSRDIPWFSDPNSDGFNPNLDQTIRSLKIINNSSQNYNYGVILNESVEGGGECSDPIISTSPNRCFTLMSNEGVPNEVSTLEGYPFIAYYAQIIKQLKNVNEHYRGVSFKSPNYYLSIHQIQPGQSRPNQNPTYIENNMYLYNGNLDNLFVDPNTGLFSYGKYLENNPPPNNPPDECMTDSLKFIDPELNINMDHTYRQRGYRSCVSEISMTGKYEVTLYTKNDATNQRLCQTFYRAEDDTNIFSISIYDLQVNDYYQQPWNIPRIFDNNQSIYKTLIIPVP